MNQEILNAICVKTINTTRCWGDFASYPLEISIDYKKGLSCGKIVSTCLFYDLLPIPSGEDAGDPDTLRGHTLEQLCIKNIVPQVFDVNVDILKWTEEKRESGFGADWPGEVNSLAQ